MMNFLFCLFLSLWHNLDSISCVEILIFLTSEPRVLADLFVTGGLHEAVYYTYTT